MKFPEGYTPTIYFKRAAHNIILPCYSHISDSGMDVRAYLPEQPTRVLLCKGETMTIPTGISAVIPKGFEIQVRPRSSLSKRGILTHFGTVDNGYTGEIKIILSNLGEDDFIIKNGDRIAQFVISPVFSAAIHAMVGEMPNTDRGAGGFGSTGVE